MPSRFFCGSDPSDEMRRIWNEINRLGTPQRESGYRAMKVYVSQDGVAVTAELPGVSEEDRRLGPKRIPVRSHVRVS